MQPPAQEIVAKDLHDNTWTFRHIYRGTASFTYPSLHSSFNKSMVLLLYLPYLFILQLDWLLSKPLKA